jgi:predicted flap endonuclease-1-like 5' DNA nuclease
VFIFTLAVVIALAALAGYVVGSRRRAGSSPDVAAQKPPAAAPAQRIEAAPAGATEDARVGAEKARIIRSRDAEAAMLRGALADRDAELSQLASFRPEREQLFRELAEARGETARYRQLIVDIENNAPPPILSGPAGPDDLKLIVGVGPVLERMLHTLGITTFRQIGRWSERDVAEFDAKLPEFPGRIVRDQWVIQARALHQSKYGESLDVRPRG